MNFKILHQVVLFTNVANSIVKQVHSININIIVNRCNNIPASQIMDINQLWIRVFLYHVYRL